MASEPVDLQALPLHMARQVFPPLWVVCERPVDFPDGYTVRVWWGMTPEPQAQGFATLELARAFIADAGGCFRFARQQGDEWPVCESWL
jgi:hypothetical protein